MLNQIAEQITNSRWFEIPDKAAKHPVISKWVNDLWTREADVYTTVAGRRSFKTEEGKRFMVSCLFSGANEVYYCGAPTRIQAKDIFWKDLKALVDSPAFRILIKNISESELSIETVDGSTLKVVGLKEFKRVQGQRCHGVLITEFQECDPSVYNESFEPMLNDTGGFAILEGRPLGKNHLHDFFVRGLNGDKGFRSYHWTAEDILSPEQILRAKTNLSLQDYNREYLASFETEHGAPYYAYSQKNNKPYVWNPNLPVIVCCDFNATIKPMSWVLGQKTRDGEVWKKSLSYQYTNTETMCRVLHEYLKEIFEEKDGKLVINGQEIKLNFFGDYAGNQDKSNSSFTDWEIIVNYFRNICQVETFLKPCRSIRNSIGATNARLCNALGEVRQFIDPNDCKNLSLDWEKCEWADNSMELKENNNGENVKRGHCCRAVDYYNDYEYPIKSKTVSKQW